MDAKIGLIGCGIMGSDHASILQADVTGARLVAVQDADDGRARALSAAHDDLRVYDTAEALIADPEIDGILIAAPDDTHQPLTLAAIAANKPVLVEKPLAATLSGCRQIIAAELSAGRQLVHVGFMRRFDPGVQAIRAELTSGTLGRALFLHCIHRNKIAPDYITSDLVIANSASHEMDLSRFVFGADHAAITVISAPFSRHAAGRQPQLIVVEMSGGGVVSIEMSPDARYGYEVRGELVCEDGTVALNPPRPVVHRWNGHEGTTVEEDWRSRFRDAYRLQLQEWVAAVRGSRPSRGASAWDGYQASRAADAGLQALRMGERVVLSAEERPALYL